MSIKKIFYYDVRRFDTVSHAFSKKEAAENMKSIEQQWESQLINDAEFTANTQLPSVTFDINNSDISQQLGQRVSEEVNRFQHVDPPRNPNGFWQRIEQRYKNNFERQALIAEGRAAANSEVMSESLGHAAVNQQNYLDIGYSESVVQTRAAEWTGLSEFPFIIPETGIATKLGNKLLQVSKLANKWGFFGRNGANDSLNNAVNHINGLRLQRQLAQEEVSTFFNSNSELSQEVINNSRRIPLKINNFKLKKILSERPGNLSDWGKYETIPIQTDAGFARMHFYHNPITGDVYYGMDYKAVFGHQGAWNFKLQPNFDFEPPGFNL